MSLLPDGATFEEQVHECFLVFRGRGLMLSALDAALVTAWADLGVPYEVVARGIRKAAELAVWDRRPGAPVLTSLKACRRQVEREIAHYQARIPGAGLGQPGEQGLDQDGPNAAEPFDVSRHRKLRANLKTLGSRRPELEPVIAELTSGILARPPGSLSEVSSRGDRVVARLIRALSFQERWVLLRTARERMGDGGRGVSHRARRLAARFHRAAVVGEALGLSALG